jgi:hypothetical protein
MLTTALSKNKNAWGIDPDPCVTTYLPSPLVLHLFLANGWKVTRTELVLSEDQSGLVYRITLRSSNFKQDQELILPKIALVEKILAEQARMTVPAQTV